MVNRRRVKCRISFPGGYLAVLTEAEYRAWATKRKYPLGEAPYSVLAEGPPFFCLNFAIPEDAGRRVALVRFVWGAVGSQQAEALPRPDVECAVLNDPVAARSLDRSAPRATLAPPSHQQL
jgi:hypothetical protein